MIFLAHQEGHKVSDFVDATVAGGESWQTRHDLQTPHWGRRWRGREWSSWLTHVEPSRA